MIAINFRLPHQQYDAHRQQPAQKRCRQGHRADYYSARRRAIQDEEDVATTTPNANYWKLIYSRLSRAPFR